ncbi:hypothetical protein [Tahibacter amnicola]|uniref:Uncharacterized protein n=1 Tax=Tahibacter amnicola TaxID=2976241 RepID=A0ABY6BLA2_9GAMM|nr:hypothetical protein [Tahibacter amnicola]UXI70213.1 hypothetical protein N4264_11440 [Tahibacter amnicola]
MAGGAINSETTAALTLNRVLLYSNRASVGGGLAVTGNLVTPKEVNLFGVGFNSNTATASGGGLYANYSDVTIGGDGINYFASNVAQGTTNLNGGGAIYLSNSDLLVDSLAPAQSPFMDNNFAQRHGGAIAYVNQSSGYHYISIFNRNRLRILDISNNATASGGKGGAIYVNSLELTSGTHNHSSVNLYNVNLIDNDASEGGAFHVEATGNSIGSESVIIMNQGTDNGGPPSCPPGVRCNSLELNRTGNSSTISLVSGGSSGHARFSMYRGYALQNISPLGGFINGNGRVYLDNSVIANNTLGNAYVIATVFHELQIRNSTFAGNTFGAGQVIYHALTPTYFRLHNSIVFQPGKQIYFIGGGVIADPRNLLVPVDHGIADTTGRNIQQTTEPFFVDPGQNNFQLQVFSSARNRYGPGNSVLMPTIDLLGGMRPTPPDFPTPYDFGAFEYGAVPDSILWADFEP